MNLLQSLSGMLEARITSGDIGESLCRLTAARVTLSHVETSGSLSASFLVSRRQFKQIQKICEIRGDKLEIQKKVGLYWKLKRMKKRSILYIGLSFLLILFLFLPTRVYFIQVEGNRSIPSARILEAAADSGLHFGISRSALRSELIKNRLLKKLPQLSWAGVNTRGCTAVVTVRERISQSRPVPTGEVSSIIASADGVVDSCTVLQGTPLCRPGQAVRRGQVLISGYTDCGSSIRAGTAAGEIFAGTRKEIALLSPVRIQKRGEIQTIKRCPGLRLGKKHIKFPWNSGIWDASCGRMYEEYYITLPGGYVLPAALTLETYTEFASKTVPRNPETAEAAMSSFARQYLCRHMIAGTILRSSCGFSEELDHFVMKGQYLCREMIGRSRQEKIGDSYGEKH